MSPEAGSAESLATGLRLGLDCSKNCRVLGRQLPSQAQVLGKTLSHAVTWLSVLC